MAAHARRSLRERCSAPVDIAWLAAFRIAFGLLMFVDVLLHFAGDRIGGYWVRPSFHFSYFGFPWIAPWAGVGMYVHFAALGVLALCIAAGFYYRVAAVLFCVGFVHVFLLDSAMHLNHAYLICLVSGIMAILPAHRAHSLDVRSGRVPPRTQVPAWTLWLLRFQIGLVYFYGGIAKIQPDWLSGLPLKFWLAGRADWPVVGPLLAQPWVTWFFAYGGLFYDLLVVPLLLWRRTRTITFVITCGFHLSNSVTFDIAIFPWLMIAASTVFFAPDWPRRIHWLHAPPGNAKPLPVRMISRAGFILLMAYVAIQALLPFRHLAYPGDVTWTEEGHRFSWRMKLRSKEATAIFHVTDPADGRTWSVDPQDLLTAWQAHRMSGRPDMVVQFARHIAERERRASGVLPEVRVRALCSLNGRLPRLLIDPTVDLATQRWGFAHAPWLGSLESEPVGGGSASEVPALATRYRAVRAELATLLRAKQETLDRIAAVERLLADRYAMKPDGLYVVDSTERTVYELTPKAEPAEVASVEDIRRNYDRNIHQRLVSEERLADLNNLMDRKQTLHQRIGILDGLRWQREETKTQVLVELQDAAMASATVEEVARAE